MANSRPEVSAAPEIYYNEKEALKYTSNSRIIEVQRTMTERAIELLNLPAGQSSLILDIGCGSALSGDVLTENGHHWIGLDISRDMLNVAITKEASGDLIESDMGNGVSFKPACFDGCISISALQWLCYSNCNTQNPVKRLSKFFTSLYSVLVHNSRAVFQFYPENDAQIELITRQALKVGFFGGVLIDFPNSTKAKKFYLTLSFGYSIQNTPMIRESESLTDGKKSYFEKSKEMKFLGKRKKLQKKSKLWILLKKEKMISHGKEVKLDSKYTGRSRRRRH